MITNKKSLKTLLSACFVLAFSAGIMLPAAQAIASSDNDGWVDITECIATECGTSEGTKEQVLYGEICDYECPTVTFEASREICPEDKSYYNSRDSRKPCKIKTSTCWWYSDKITETFGPIDVVYSEKSEDPNHCHRPTGSSLGIPSWAIDEYNNLNPELLPPDETNCRTEIIDTRIVDCYDAEIIPCDPETTDVTLCKEDEDGKKLGGWVLSLVSGDLIFSGTTEPKCSNTGCVILKDVPYGTYEIQEELQKGWENVSGLDSVQIKSENPKFIVINKEKEEEPITGSITVCKIIIDSEGNIVDGSEKRGAVFIIPGLSSGDIPGTSPAPIGAIPTSEFETPLQFNADLIGNNGINDAQCITYDGLELGGYYYGEELLPGEGWETPLYNDQHITGVSSLTDFFEFSGELLDGNPDNDHERNTDADGHIILSESRPDRTLVVLNQYKEIAEDTATIKAYKVVCEDESDLPNWAKTSGYPAEITEDLITEYVEDSEGKCWLESDWEFEWGYDNTAQKQDGNFYGPAGESKGWNAFDSATGSDTPAVLELEENELESIIWIREVLQEGYIPFAHPETGWDTGEEMVSAELLCHIDGYKYDNYDRVDNPQAGGTYFCVAFNTPEEVPVTDVTLCKEDENGKRLGGWVLSLVSDELTLSGTTAPLCKHTGCVTLEDVPYGNYEIQEELQKGWENVSGLDKVQIKSENPKFIVVNKEKEEIDVVTIKAYKVVCEDESDLPNWGAVKADGNPVDEDTAQNFLNQVNEGKDEPVCWLEDGWYFEWAEQTASNPGDNIIGPAGEGWTTFGPTDNEGQATTTIDNLAGIENHIWMREVMQEGYVPFSGTTGPEHDDVSAEFYCHVDVLNYDNYDRIDNPQLGQTYYCVAFNALEEPVEPTYYEVTFKGNGGEPGTQIEEVEEGKTVDSLPTVTRKGYSFVEWNTDSERQGDVFTAETIVTADITVYAIWEEKDPDDTFYTLEVSVDGFGWVTSDPEGINCGYGESGCEKEYKEDTEVTLTAEPGSGQEFDGWTGDCAGTDPVCVLTIDGPKAVSAAFSLIPGVVTYTVTFDGNEGTPATKDIIVEEGETIDPLPTVTRTGYSFVGWNKEKDGEGDEFTSSTQVTAHITVYAQWEVKSYTVSFEDWDNTVLKEEIVEHGSAATAPDDPEREDYTFTGWDTDFTNVTEDLTVTALYEKDTEPEPAPARRIGGPVYIPTDDPEPEEERITIPLGDPDPEPEPEEEVLGEEIVIDCDIYLHEYIKYGADNNPEEVRKLQLFLNDYMGTSLSVTGVYDQVTMQAVKEFQAKHKDEVLQPWIAAGVHCHTEPTGYVYKTTQRMINMIMCPPLNLPMPEVSAYPETDCTAYWVAVLGEEAVVDEPFIGDRPVDEEDPEYDPDDVIDPEEEVVTDPEDPEEETEIPWLLILIIIILVIGFGWMAHKSTKGKKGTGFSGKKPISPQGKSTSPQGKSTLFESKATPPQGKSNMFENKSNPFESRTIPLGGKKPDSFERR